jgi:hypothetical protein
VQRFQSDVPLLSISWHLEAADEPKLLGKAEICFSTSESKVPGFLDDAAAGSWLSSSEANAIGNESAIVSLIL